MTAIQSRVFVPHRRGCHARKYAQNGEWIHAWSFIKDSYVCRHPVTKKWLRFTYVVWGCNGNDCPALLGLRQSDIEALLPRW